MPLLGIDIGGTKWALAVGDDAGHPVPGLAVTLDFVATGDAERDLAVLEAAIRRLLERAKEVGHAPIDRIGCAAPGPVDQVRGVLMSPPNLPGWGEVGLSKFLGDRFGVPVRVENDANAATLTEWRFGAGQGTRNLVFLTMSTGIGAGMILDGRLHRGATGNAGEIGHSPIEFPGRPCHCGRSGCLEAYCGGRAWQSRLREPHVVPADSSVLERAGRREEITPKHLVAAAHSADPFACAEMERWVGLLAQGLIQVVQFLDPERILLGTIARAAGDALCFEPLRERLEASLWPHQRGRIEILPAALDDLPLHAGLAVAVEDPS